jgi:rhamnulokinase
VCRNIIGLWLIQELCRKWDIPADPWNYERMTREASFAKSGPILDVADESLLSPPDMEKALMDLLLIHGQPSIDTRGKLVRCVLESLALEYAFRLNMMRYISNSSIESLFIVGGGIANTLLCQLTANACDLQVFAGVPQCTSVGNALVQANALGIVSGPEHIRKIMRNSFDLISYMPRDSRIWKEKLDLYSKLKGEKHE